MCWETEAPPSTRSILYGCSSWGQPFCWPGAQLCPLLWGRSGGLSLALAAILIIYALGGCILSGLFPVSETKAMETLSAKIHGFGSVLGFLALTFAPLVVALFISKARQTRPACVRGVLSPGVGILRAVSLWRTSPGLPAP